MFSRSSLRRLIAPSKKETESPSTRTTPRRKDQPQQHHHHINIRQGPTSAGGTGFYDDDPGIMSEVETSATGNFKRGSRVRSSLPIVRSASATKTSLSDPRQSLGLVFLQYRSETKRTLLPNQVTSLDTVKALFVRSFKTQVNMSYLNSRNVRIYIHDASKDIFYELEDVKDVKDRSVLRIYEQDLENGTWQPVGGLRPEHPRVLNQQVNQELRAAAQASSRSAAVTGPQQGPASGNWMDDPSYFSEPEFDAADVHNLHIHRSRRERASFGGPIPPSSHPATVNSSSQSQYYGTIIIPTYRTAAIQQQISNGSTSSQGSAPRPPERGKPYAGYSQTMPRNMSLASHGHAIYGNIPGSLQKASHPQQASLATQNQRSVSPDLVSKKQHKDQMVTTPSGPGAPPKPQRSFTALIGIQRRPPGGTNGTSGGNQINNEGPMSPNHGQQVFVRPLPDRPFSVTGQFPPNGNGPTPDRRSIPEYTGYLSSPERRLPSGEIVRNVYGVAPGPMSLPYEHELYGYGGSRPSSVAGVGVDEMTRVKMESMERQLANLTGLVQAALVQPGHQPGNQPTKEEKSVSFSLGEGRRKTAGKANSSNRYSYSSFPSTSTSSPATDKPTKSAIKRQSSAPVQSYPPEKARPAPPPKPSSFAPYSIRSSTESQSSIAIPEIYYQLKALKSKTKDLKSEFFSLRNMARSQSQNTKEILRDTCHKVNDALAFLNSNDPIERRLRLDRLRLSRDEETYRNDVRRLEKDLTDLETTVEELRSNVINRRCKVNMAGVENMAHVLSRASKMVGDLKLRYPHLQDSLRNVMQAEMEVVVQEEKFLKEEPEKLESALRRCKKLTGTLVTLKRLASVQEQRSTAASTSSPSTLSAVTVNTSKTHQNDHQNQEHRESRTRDNHHHHHSTGSHPLTLPVKDSSGRSLESAPHTIIQITPATPTLKTDPRGESALDALLEELQTFAKPSPPTNASSKKPVPPPRSSSRINEQAQQLMLLSSLTAAALQTARSARSNSIPADAIRPKSTPPVNACHLIDETLDALQEEERRTAAAIASSASNSSISSVDSQIGLKSRQQVLENRHQELLRKQRLLQEQYSKLQMLSRGQIPQGLLHDLKKTGSESNIMSKSGPSIPGGSLTQLIPHHSPHVKPRAPQPPVQANGSAIPNGKAGGKEGKHSAVVETQKIYETDIL